MEAGTRLIGSYEVVRELGHGGMAVVYLARQPGLDRLVALKEMAAFGVRDPQMVHRFLREAQIAASLTHPNIVTVHEAFAVDGLPYISMEYVEAGSLRALVGRLGLGQTLALLEDVLAALTAAERRGIVHRDLKPENVLITDNGHAKIADFGIAKAVDHAATADFRTATGMTVGTPAYMAPEQAMGSSTVTGAADLYSLGIMAYELLLGRLPFAADSPVGLLLKQVSDPPPPPLSLDPSLDPELADWVERLLIKEPGERLSSAAQASDELDEIAIRLLGPRWRRTATLAGPEAPTTSGYVTVDPDRLAPVPGPWTPPPDLPWHDAPAPDADTFGPAARPPVVPRPSPAVDATVSPQRPVPTPTGVTPVPDRRRRLGVLVALVLLCAAGTGGALLARPDSGGAPARTGSVPTAQHNPVELATSAYRVALPAGWSVLCSGDAGYCRTWENWDRAVVREGTALEVWIDHSPQSRWEKGVGYDNIKQAARANLHTLDAFALEAVATKTVGDRRAEELRFSFQSPRGPARGHAFVLRERGTYYVITGVAERAADARTAARAIALTLEPVR